jgi:cytochrome P450 family 2 subfamily J
MIREPRVQERVRKEIHDVLGQFQQPTLSDRQRLPFTDATTMEIQRMANVCKIFDVVMMRSAMSYMFVNL